MIRFIALFSLLWLFSVSLRAQPSAPVQSFLLQLKKSRYISSDDHNRLSQLSDTGVYRELDSLFRWRDKENYRSRAGGLFSSSLSRTRALIEMAERSGILPLRILAEMRALSIDPYLNPNGTVDPKSRWRAFIALDEEVHFFRYLNEYHQYQQNLGKGQPRAYLDSLESWGLLGKGIEILQDSSYTPHSFEDVLALLDKALLIEPSALPQDLALAYQQSMAQVAQLDPRLAFSDFSLEIVQSPASEAPYELAKVSFTCADQIYIFYNNFYHTTGETEGRKLGPYFFQIFNKILVENQSPYRLVRFRLETTERERVKKNYDNPTYTLALLDSFQYSRLATYESDPSFTYRYWDPEWYRVRVIGKEAAFDILDQAKLLSVFRRYEELGLYSEYSTEERQELLETFQQGFMYGPQSLLAVRSVMLTYWTLELDKATPYLELLSEVQEICRGQLTFADSTLLREADSLQLAFTWENQQFKIPLPPHETPSLPRLIQALNDWLVQAEVGLTFYPVKPLPNRMMRNPSIPGGYLLLDEKQYQALRNEHLVRFWE